MVAGLKLQLVFAGSPEHAKVTCPENPAAPVTLMGADTVWPALTVNVVVPLLPGASANAALTIWVRVVEEGLRVGISGIADRDRLRARRSKRGGRIGGRPSAQGDRGKRCGSGGEDYIAGGRRPAAGYVCGKRHTLSGKTRIDRRCNCSGRSRLAYRDGYSRGGIRGVVRVAGISRTDGVRSYGQSCERERSRATGLRREDRRWRRRGRWQQIDKRGQQIAWEGHLHQGEYPGGRRALWIGKERGRQSEGPVPIAQGNLAIAKDEILLAV